jgi:hypothetical protein
MGNELKEHANSLKAAFESWTEPDPKHGGVFHASRVRFTSFVIISLCLFAAAVQCILAVWGYVGQDTAWRALTTLGIVSITMVVFAILNEMFGSMMRN